MIAQLAEKVLGSALLEKVKAETVPISIDSVTGDDLTRIFTVLGMRIRPEQAEMLASKASLFAERPGESLFDFLTNGGLIRMVAGPPEEVSICRCPHCKNLIL